jgi:hypothetical protein
MSVYVGIDVHRKRSRVAVVNEGGEVLANRNVPNGVKPILSVIGLSCLTLVGRIRISRYVTGRARVWGRRGTGAGTSAWTCPGTWRGEAAGAPGRLPEL